jgi:hypothetical protein
MESKTILGLLLVVCVLGSRANAMQTSATCDRECLRGKVTQLLYAFLKHDVSKLPVADKLRVTEDAVEKPLASVGLVNTVARRRGWCRCCGGGEWSSSAAGGAAEGRRGQVDRN